MRALVALATAVLVVTGVALATPVPVLSIGDGSREFLGAFADGEALEYSWRQSIYEVPVFEDMERDGDRIDLVRVRSSDIRSVEYFGWEGEIRQGDDGLFFEDAPPSENVELVIRITPAGQQRISTGRWSVDLRPRFGETVVRVRAEQRPFLIALLGGIAP